MCLGHHYDHSAQLLGAAGSAHSQKGAQRKSQPAVDDLYWNLWCL